MISRFKKKKKKNLLSDNFGAEIVSLAVSPSLEVEDGLPAPLSMALPPVLCRPITAHLPSDNASFLKWGKKIRHFIYIVVNDFL